MGTCKSEQILLPAVVFTLTIALFGCVFVRAETIISVVELDNVPKEIDAPLPVYPLMAREQSPEGMVTVKFDINKEGYVENPCIYNSSLPGEFDLYALQAIKDHRYEPPDGSPQDTTGVTKNFFFTLDAKPKDPVMVKYPRRALEHGAEGYVVVRFGVSAWGDVRDLEIAGAEPAGFFETAALDAASKMKFVTTRFKPDQKVMHKFNFSLNSKPTKAVIAEYPATAKAQKLHGHVIVEFDINTDGEVENPEAIYSVASVFETAAIAAIAKFRFNPHYPAKGVLHKIEFNLDQDYQPLSRVEPDYPRQALLDSVEGYVIVEFDIDEAGRVDNPSVMTAKPRDVFNESALNAIEQFKYTPKYVDGQPTRVTSALIKFIYSLDRGNRKNSGRALEDKERQPNSRHKLKPTHTLYIEGDQEDGSVIVEFDVNELGFVEQPSILQVQDTVLSDQVAQRILDEVSYYWYTPLVKDDVPVSTFGVRHRIELQFREDKSL